MIELETNSVFREIRDKIRNHPDEEDKKYTEIDLRNAYYAGYEEGIVPMFSTWIEQYKKGK